jgi:hypothetical protein
VKRKGDGARNIGIEEERVGVKGDKGKKKRKGKKKKKTLNTRQNIRACFLVFGFVFTYMY